MNHLLPDLKIPFQERSERLDSHRHNAHQGLVQWPDSIDAAYDRNTIEENFNRDITEGYEPKSRAERLPLGSFFAISNFVKCPWCDRIPAVFQTINVQWRYTEINHPFEFEYDIATYCLSKGLNPICGCEIGNVASQPTLEAAGFASLHTLVEFETLP